MLESFDSYVIALVKLMDRLPYHYGRAKQVIERFGDSYADQIPSEHYSKNASGRVRWLERLLWARHKAAEAGLIDSPARGIWRLTEDGEKWLVEHPNATRLVGVDKVARAIPRRGAEDEEEDEDEVQESPLADLRSWLEQAEFAPEPERLRKRLVLDGDRLCIPIRTMRKSHYEISSHPDCYEIALHFENSNQARNQALVLAFEPHLTAITETLRQTAEGAKPSEAYLNMIKDVPLRVGMWGPDDRWGRVWLELPSKTLLDSAIIGYVLILQRFIRATWDIFKAANESFNTGIVAVSEQEDNDSRHDILEREIRSIRDFLQGRSDSRPSDEKLCDWVQFCYLFELYKDGRDLFALVNSADVHPWLLERTRKLARICALKANSDA